jgi:hypothetical protein
MLIKDLKSPYKELAELRRAQYGSERSALGNSFLWLATPEGDEFWRAVDIDCYPVIPLDSLAELAYKEQRELIFKLI